jgi:hypothetical protein
MARIINTCVLKLYPWRHVVKTCFLHIETPLSKFLASLEYRVESMARDSTDYRRRRKRTFVVMMKAGEEESSIFPFYTHDVFMSIHCKHHVHVSIDLMIHRSSLERLDGLSYVESKGTSRIDLAWIEYRCGIVFLESTTPHNRMYECHSLRGHVEARSNIQLCRFRYILITPFNGVYMWSCLTMV